VAVGDLGEGTRLAALTGAWICFEDEAGQSLRPGRARTWAPRGHTPVVRVSGNSGRLSVVGMACMKPGQPGRFFYRLRVHRRRKGERPSLSEADAPRYWTGPWPLIAIRRAAVLACAHNDRPHLPESRRLAVLEEAPSPHRHERGKRTVGGTR
jgi:hypothetical protein